MNVESREYKLLIAHEAFVDPARTAEEVWVEIEDALSTLPGVQTKSKLDEVETREIFFLDTSDFTLRRNGLILRQRAADKALEWTLKCRSEDQYFAAGTDVRAGSGFDDDRKLEEDIAPPFRCRYSHSATITADEKKAPKTPKTIADAAALFPVLKTLRSDGRVCAPETALKRVNDIVVNEAVWKGGKIHFASNTDDKPPKATVALIVWSRGKAGRPAVAELSFRIKFDEDRFNRNLAVAARAVYAVLLRLDCARIGGLTKTEYIYRDNLVD